MGMNSDYQVRIKAVTDKASFEDVKRSFSQVIDGLSKMDLNSKLKDSKTTVAQAATEVQKLQKAYNEAFSSTLGSVNLQTFNKLLDPTTTKLAKVQQAYRALGNDGDRMFKSFATDILTANRGLKQTHTIIDDMATTMGNTIKWGISSSIMNSFTGAISQAASYVQDLDKSLNNIRIVSEKSADQMAVFAKNANNAAKALGSTTLQYSDAALIYYQQGLSDEKVKQMTDITIKMSNVLGTSAEDVSNYMTAIWNNFYEEGGKSLEYYADVITKLGAATASSAEEISTGLEKFAAIADTVGLSYEYATAALTTVTATTRQSAEVVGTAFKTLFARIQDLELGNTLEDGVTLGKYSEALNAVGINILKANGDLKDMDDILDEMGAKWGKLTDAQKVSLAQTVAGTRQYTQLVALMDNWDYFTENLTTATNATGSLDKQQQVYLESTEAHINAANAAWDDFKDSLIDTDLINFFADLSRITGNILGFAVDSLGGGLSTTFLGLSGILKLLNNQLSTTFTDMIFNFKSVKDVAAAAAAEMQTVQLLEGLKYNKKHFAEIIDLKKEFLSYGKLVSNEQNDEINALLRKKTLRENEIEQLQDELREVERLANAVKQSGLSEINLLEESFSKSSTGTDSDTESIQDNFESAKNAFAYLYQQANDYDTLITDLGRRQLNYAQQLNTVPEAIKNNLTVQTDLFSGKEKEPSAKAKKKYEKELQEHTDKYTKLLQENTEKYRQQWGIIQEHFSAIFTSSKYEKEFKNELQELNQILEGENLDTSALETKVKQILEKVRQIAEENRQQMEDPTSPFLEGSTKQDLKETNAAIEEYRKKLAFAQNTQAWINMASQVGTLTSSIMALTNVTKIWGDTTISNGEKIMSIMTSLGYSIPMLASSLSAVNKSLPKIMSTIAGKDAKWLKDAKGNAFGSLTEMLMALPGKAKLVAAAVVAALAVIAVTAYAIHQKSIEDEKQVQHLEAAYEQLTTELEETRQQAEALQNTFQKYEEIKDTLAGCTKGTKEWEEAVGNLNASVADLLAAYPELTKIQGILERDKLTGALVFNEDKLNNFIQQYEKKLTNQEQAVLMMAGSIAEAKNEVEVNDLKGNLNKSWMAIHNEWNRINNARDGARGNVDTTESRKLTGLSNLYNQGSPITKENYKEWSGLSTEEFEEKLRNAVIAMDEADGQLDLSNEALEEYITSTQQYQKAIDDCAAGAEEAATQLHTAAKYIANTILGEGAGEAENRYATTLYEKTFKDEKDKIEDSLEGDNINVWSGKDNKKYKDVLEELQDAGYNLSADSNAVRGTDGNRSLAFRDSNGKEVVYSSEQVAEMLAAYRAQQAVEKEDTKTNSDKAVNALAKGAGIDKELADKLLGEDFSVYDLTAEEYEKVKDIDWSKVTGFTNDNATALGGESAKSMLNAIDAEIESYDAEKAAEKLIQDFKTAMKSAAEGLDVNVDGFESYTEQLIKNSEALDENEMFAITAAKAHYKLSQNLNDLNESVEDNEELLRSWAKGAEVSTDEAEKIGKTISALESALGQEVSDDFVKRNIEDIIKLAKGDMSVLDDLQKKLAEDYILSELKIENLDDLPTEVNNAIKAINATDLEKIEVGTTLDQTSLQNSLQEMLARFQMTEEQANAILKNIGFEPEVQMVKATWEDGNGTSATLKYTDPATGEEKTVTNYATTETKGSVMIPVINGKNTRFLGLTDKDFDWKPKKPSGGGSAKPKKETKLKDEKDRYHDVNIELKKISNSLEKVQKQQRGLTGKDLIENLAQQYALLNKEIETTAKKMRIAEGEADELAKKLSKKGVKFGSDGTITNYADAYDKQLAKVNAVIEKYNKMTSKQQEKYQDTLDKAKEEWNEFLENISRYDEILTEELPSMMSDIQDNLSEQIDLKLEGFEYEVKIRLDLAEAKKEWNEFKADILEGRDLENDPLAAARVNRQNMDALYNSEGTGSLQASTNHINKIMEQLAQMDAHQVAGIYGETYTYTNSKGEDVTIDYNDRAKALEDLKTYIDENIGGLTEFNELMGGIYGNYVDLLGKIQEGFDKQTEAFETLDSMIQHDMELIKMAYGEDEYKKLSDLYDKDLENSKAKLAALSSQVDYWKAEVADQRAYVATLEKGTDEWWRASEALAAAEENLNGAIDAESQAVLDAMQKITDKLLFNIDKTFSELNKSLTNGLGLEYASMEWELIGARADDYLDTVNAIYSTQQLQNKYLDAIEKSSNPAHQKKLNDLMEQETKYLREQDKLSQYDLDRANLKYELALKQIALEEAQQNKSKLRLRRDSQGNYTYQYTADNDQVASVQQEINDLYNQLYNLDADEYRGNLEKIYDVWAEAQEKMKEAAQINDPDKRLAYEQLITKEYGDRINALTEENENIKSNLYQSTMSQLLELYNTDTANYEQMTEDQKAILDEYITAETELNGAAFDNMFNLYNENIVNLQSMADEQKDILMTSIVPQWNSAYQQMINTIVGKGGFEATLGAAFETIKAQALAAFEELEKYETEYSERSENNKTYITDQLTSAETLLNMYKTDLPQIKSMISELAEAWDAVTTSIGLATTAASNYYTTTQEKNANDAKDEDVEPTNEEGGKEGSGDTGGNNDTGSGGNTGNNQDSKPSLTKGSSIKLKAGTKWYSNSYGGGSYGSTAKQKSVTITLVNESGSHPYHVNQLGWVRKKDIVGYASGGYTGDWAGSDGRLAMLHKKELILNAHDTDNMLDAITILRDITSNLGATLLNRMASINASGIGALGAAGATAGLEQMVTINAEFPNVTNSHEIEDAINNLVNRASQHIHKN